MGKSKSKQWVGQNYLARVKMNQENSDPNEIGKKDQGPIHLPVLKTADLPFL